MTKTCALTALSLLALAGTAFADPGDDLGTPVSQFRATTGAYPAGFPPASGNREVTQDVYSNIIGFIPNFFGTNTVLGQGAVNVLDDINFNPGPWGDSFAGTRLATGMVVHHQYSGHTANGDFDIVYDFFDGPQLDYSRTTGMLDGAALSRFILPIRAEAPNFFHSFDVTLTGLPGGGVSFPSATAAVRVRFVRVDQDPDQVSSLMRTGTTALNPPPNGINPTSNPDGYPVAQVVFHGWGANPSVGSSDVSYGRDHNLDGIFTGAASPGGNGANERRVTLTNYNMNISLQGDVPPPPAPTTTGDFATLDCNGSSTVSLNGALNSIPPVNMGDPELVQVQWFSVTLPGDASVAAVSFFDVFATDNSGSSVSYITGIYNSDGGLVASDLGTGFLTCGQMSFGDTAPRGNAGGTADFDGRNGDLAAGTYYIAVTGTGAGFGGGFAINTATVSATGPFSIAVRSNLSASGNCTPPSPVAPTATQDLGTLPQAATTTFTGTTGSGLVAWIKFATDYSVGSADPTQYLDIDTQGSSSVADTQIGLFDSAGVLVGQDDDTGGNGGKSQLSFGDPTRSRTSGGPNPFAGQDGDTLAAGDYYLCAGLFLVDFGANGWRARSNSGSNLNTVVNFFTTIPPSGCPADFNADTVLNSDDLSDFITGFFDIPSDPRCDFNGDTVINADDLGDFITAFFNGC